MERVVVNKNATCLLLANFSDGVPTGRSKETASKHTEVYLHGLTEDKATHL